MTQFDTYASIGRMFRKHYAVEDRLGRSRFYPRGTWLLCMGPASLVGYALVLAMKAECNSRPEIFDVMAGSRLGIAAGEVESHGISMEEARVFWLGVRNKIFGPEPVPS